VIHHLESDFSMGIECCISDTYSYIFLGLLCKIDEEIEA